ncbi:MAG: hypothetical protein QM790_03405 [Nibricoccus sp.]
MSTLPEGWTDDMRIAIAPGSETALVDLIFSQLLAFVDASTACHEIQTRFHLTEDDAYLALDRVPGGVIRALTGNPANRPDPSKDPLAHIAFEKVWSELPRVHWFSMRRKSIGRWHTWFEELRNREKSG